MLHRTSSLRHSSQTSERHSTPVLLALGKRSANQLGAGGWSDCGSTVANKPMKLLPLPIQSFLMRNLDTIPEAMLVPPLGRVGASKRIWLESKPSNLDEGHGPAAIIMINAGNQQPGGLLPSSISRGAINGEPYALFYCVVESSFRGVTSCRSWGEGVVRTFACIFCFGRKQS